MPVSRRLLEDDEEVIVDLHPHWVFFVAPATVTVVALAVAIVVATGLPKAPVGVAWVLAAMVAVPAVWFGVRFTNWLATSLVLTDRRLVLRRGVLAREERPIWLADMSRVRARRTLVERLIGAGGVLIDLVGEDEPVVLDDVQRPKSLVRVLDRQRGLVAGGSSPAGEVAARPGSLPRRPAADDPTPPQGVARSAVPVGPGQAQSLSEQLIALDELRRRGILTPQEFEAKKAELLSRL